MNHFFNHAFTKIPITHYDEEIIPHWGTTAKATGHKPVVCFL